MSLLAEGGFSHTYMAKDTHDKSLCVVKHLFFKTGEEESEKEARRLFKIETNILEKLNSHSQIPNLIDFVEEHEELYIVQEYIEGVTLAQKMQSEKKWGEKDVIDFLKEMLDILRYIHNFGIIHRDIKPENIIVRNIDQKMVLIDFGAVKEFDPQKSQLISPTIAIGTRGYMPIEQIQGRPRKNSDIYALGMIAIEALAGCQLLDLSEDSQGCLIWQNYSEASIEINKIIDKMVHPNCLERYQSAIQVIDALNEYESTLSQSLVSRLNSLPQIKKRTTIQPQMPPPPKNFVDGLIKSFLTWTKSPTGKNTILAASIGIIATASTYVFNVAEDNRRKSQAKAILAQIQSDYDRQNYNDCLQKSIDPENKQKHVDVQKITEFMVKCGIASAQVFADQYKYKEAIQELEQIPMLQIPSESKLRQLVVEKADRWSHEIKIIAHEKYTKQGDLNSALELLGEISKLCSGSCKQDSEDLQREWSAEVEKVKPILEKAKIALEYNEYRNVIDYAQQISRITSTEYWLLEAKRLAEKAAQEIKKEDKKSAQGMTNAPIVPPTIAEPLPEQEDVIVVPDILY